MIKFREHANVARTLCSVRWRHIGDRLDVRTTDSIVQLFHDGQLIVGWRDCSLPIFGTVAQPLVGQSLDRMLATLAPRRSSIRPLGLAIATRRPA